MRAGANSRSIRTGSRRLQRSLQRLRIVTDQPGGLCQPRRSSAPQQASEPVRIRAAHQPFQRLEERHVWLARTMLLDAGPCPTQTSVPNPPRPAPSRNVFTKALFPIPAEPVTKASCRLPSLAFASSCSRRSLSPGPPDEDWSLCFVVRGGKRCGTTSDWCHFGDEAKTSPMHCLDVAWALGVVTQRLAQLADRLGERVRRYRDVRPNCFQGSSLLTSTPGCWARCRRTDHVFGRNGTG